MIDSDNIKKLGKPKIGLGKLHMDELVQNSNINNFLTANSTLDNEVLEEITWI